MIETFVTPPEPVRFHEFANLFPMLDGKPREELVADIAANGMQEPIVMMGPIILDGRNRYMCARETGAEIKAVQFDGDDPLAFVISKNLKRRHMTESQRAMVAAKLAKLPKGVNQHAPIGGPSNKQAAEMLSVGQKSIERAKIVENNGAPGLVEAVQSDQVKVSAAADIASLPIAEQVALIEQADPKAFQKVAAEVRATKTAAKKTKRIEREADLSKKISALPDKKYGVILADPEWRFEPYSRETGMDRSPDNHYPTSETADIKSRDVESIASDDCVLFLWATAPMIQQALDTMKAWGFEYKTHCIWNKVRNGNACGTGYWFTGEHELCLVGTRGNVPAPAPGTQFTSNFSAPVGKHSEKPDDVHKVIEAYFPNLPKIELNARSQRPGWDVWGYEAEPQEVSA
ncbi:MAG: MT-A70 family methyltransferase [Hyphomicrobiales bacterium]